MNSRLRSLSPPGWLFLLTFGVRLSVIVRLSLTPFFLPDTGDMKFYNDWALRVAHGVWTDHQAFYGLPGYPFLLAFLHRILNYDTFAVAAVAGVIQALADAATAVFIWKIAGEVFPGAKERERISPAQAIGGLAAIGWALYQPAQAFSAVLMPTALAVATYWLCVWQFSRKRPASLWLPWLPLGVLIGAEAMIVATILFAVPLGIASVLLRYREAPGATLPKAARALAATGLLIAGVYAGAAPCWIHNYFIAHEPVMLSAHSGLNFYIGNNPLATGYPKLPPGMSAGQQGMLKDSISIAEAAVGHPLKHYEVSRFWAAKAHDYIAQHPGDWLRLLGKKFVNFWNSFQYDDLSLVSLFGRLGLLVPGPRFGLVAALALPGLLLALLRCRRAGWIVAGVLLHMLALMPVFITERYRLAAVPGLLLLAAYGLWEFWQFLTRAEWLPATGYACAGALAAAFVAQPPADIGLWSLDHYNTGVKAMDAGDFPTAERELETAYRYVPDNSEINFALGLLWQQRQQDYLAKTFYRRSLDINPRNDSAWNNLGILAGGENAWAVALRCFQQSAMLEPDEAKTYFFEARAYAEMGKWDQAKASVGEALRRAPDQKEFQQLAGEIESRSLAKSE